MIRSVRFWIIAIAAAGFLNLVSASGASAQGILKEILGRMDNHYKKLKSLRSDIVRAQENPQLRTVDNYEGKLVLLPGKGKNFSVRIDWSKPKEEIISVVNSQYVIYVPGIKRAYTGSSESQKLNDGGGGNVLKTMSMSEAELRANYDVQYLGQVQLGSDQVWHLKLTPKTKAKYKFAELWVDGNGMPLQGRVTALNDDTDTFRLKNIQENASINAAIFKVSLARGTEIIKQ